MNAVVSTARDLRAEHRHELRTLTYLTVDGATGGVIRNLNQRGISAQMLKTLRPGQQVRLRFELRSPKVRVEGLAEVVWTIGSGQCGMRFVDLPRTMRRQINEWILSDLLEAAALHSERSGLIFSRNLFEVGRPEDADSLDEPIQGGEQDDGLVISGAAARVITLPLRPEPASAQSSLSSFVSDQTVNLDWLSQPLSARSLARLIDMLAVIASFFLFVLIFLSVTGEAPPAPFAMAAAGLVLVTIVYWAFFWVFGGESLGSRLARKAGFQRNEKSKEITD